MSNSQALVKQIVGAQIVEGTLDAMKTTKPESKLGSAMNQTAKFTQDVVGGALLGSCKTSSDIGGDSGSSGIIKYQS